MDWYSIVDAARRKYGSPASEPPIATLARGLIDKNGVVQNHADDVSLGRKNIVSKYVSLTGDTVKLSNQRPGRDSLYRACWYDCRADDGVSVGC